MKKFLSIFAAMLFAANMVAEPVVLPAVLDVTNVSFRSEGLPDFVIEEGQEYAGTYFDMGAHDSSNDTLLYAEWDVTIQPIKYNIAVDVYNTNSWRVQLYLLNQAGDTLKDLRYKGSSGQKGQFAIGALDLRDLEAGDYKVQARAATAWSAMKLKDVIFEADYQGVSVALPGTLLPAYAELSSGASIANNAIAFAPGTAPDEYATWNVSFAKAGDYNVSIDMTASNGHTYGVALLSADGASEIDAVAEAQAWDTGVKELGAIAVPVAGDYKVKLTNATKWSEAVLNSITFAAPAEVVYYLVGSMNGWTASDSYAFEANPEAEGEYMITADLAEGDEFKVKSSEDAWYPDGVDNNYTVDAAHAGTAKKIYFRPDGQGGNDWHEGVLFVEENEEPEPVEGPVVVYNWAKVEAEQVGTTILGTSSVEISTVKIHENKDVVDAIKFSSSYKYEDGKYIVIKPAEGAFKEGDKLHVAAVYSNDAVKRAQVDIYAADTQTRLFLSDSALTINGKTNAADPIEQIYTLEADQDSIFIGRNGGTALFITLLKVVRGEEEEQPEETKYYLKNNWDAGIDWTWKEMTKEDDHYILDSVVFGGNGVNVNTVESDVDAKWFPIENIYAFNELLIEQELHAKDTVRFIYTPSLDSLEALILAHYIEGETIEHTYTVAGAPAAVFGQEWKQDLADNDMVEQEDGTYKWEKTELTLAAGNIQFKVCEDHAWAVAYPANNYVLPIAEAGIYTVTITFDPESEEVAANAEKTGSAEVDPTVSVKGSWDSWASELVFTLAEDKASATLTVDDIAVGTYEFKVILNGGDWRSDAHVFTREAASAEGITGNLDNMKLVADVEGEYTFTWTFATNALSIVFPEGVPVVPRLADGYYLVGSFAGEDYWTVDAIDENFLFTRNEQAEAEEYTIVLTLAEGDKFKAVKVESDIIAAWYPDGEDNDYVVDGKHAGEKTVYFRPVANEDWGGHFYVEPDSEEALDLLNVEAKAVKSLENGILVIRKNGKAYTVTGLEIK